MKLYIEHVVLVLVIVVGMSGSRTLAEFQSSTCDSPTPDQFILQVFKKLVSKTPLENVAMSPSALIQGFSLLYEAAEGFTKRNIRETIGFPEDKRQLRQLIKTRRDTIMNSVGASNVLQRGTRICADKVIPITDKYKETIRNYYINTTVHVIDAAHPRRSAEEINAWAKKVTMGLISTIVQPADLGDRPVIAMITYEYFQARWQTPFNPQDTKLMDFNVGFKEVVRIPFMYMHAMCMYSMVPEAGVELLRLPYKNSGLSFTVFLPPPGTSLDDIDFSQLNTSRYFSGIEPEMCDIYLPKFTVESATDLTSILLQFRKLEPLFNREGNFSPMVGDELLALKTVKQKVYMQVDEGGTTSAAVQAIILENRNMPILFEANRPYFYLIQDDRTGIILFIGTFVGA